MEKIPIGIIGVGMVGGAYARWFESQGHRVFRFDTNGAGSMEDVNKAEVILIAVPTPFDEAAGRFDGSTVKESIAGLIGSKTVIIKSTALPGTTEQLQAAYPSHRILFSPEFLTEATADEDVAHPKMNLVGYTAASKAVASEVMALFARAPFEKILPSREAEFFKYLRNSFFATKVVFFNQMYDLCERLGLDYESVRECAASDSWIGAMHTAVWHKGYRGYGGKCLPKDVRSLVGCSEERGVAQKLLNALEEINKTLGAAKPKENIIDRRITNPLRKSE